MTALLESAEHAHQDRLGLGPFLTSVGVAVFPQDDRRSDLPLGVVVIGGDIGMVQEREQFGLVSP